MKTRLVKVVSRVSKTPILVIVLGTFVLGYASKEAVVSTPPPTGISSERKTLQSPIDRTGERHASSERQTGRHLRGRACDARGGRPGEGDLDPHRGLAL
ncbi:MAG: hypothetical protein ACE5FA_15055, partial [Dehalococcoidia bacterium]